MLLVEPSPLVLKQDTFWSGDNLEVPAYVTARTGNFSTLPNFTVAKKAAFPRKRLGLVLHLVSLPRALHVVHGMN